MSPSGWCGSASRDEKRGWIGAIPGPVFEALRQNPLFDGLCGVQTALSTVEVRGVPEPLAGHALSGDCYQTLGIRPALGRLFARADDVPNGRRVAVLSYDFWQSAFGRQATVLGRSIRIEGELFTIIGVTPPTFHSMLLGFPPRVSIPITQEIDPRHTHDVRTFYWADAFARRKPGVTMQQVRTLLKVEWPRLMQQGLPPRFQGSDRAELVAIRALIARNSSPCRSQ